MVFIKNKYEWCSSKYLHHHQINYSFAQKMQNIKMNIWSALLFGQSIIVHEIPQVLIAPHFVKCSAKFSVVLYPAVF